MMALGAFILLGGLAAVTICIVAAIKPFAIGKFQLLNSRKNALIGIPVTLGGAFLAFCFVAIVDISANPEKYPDKPAEQSKSAASAAASVSASSSSSSSSEAPIQLTDVSVETYLKDTDTDRITSVGVNDEAAYFFVRMKPTDIGGMIEAGTTPRNMGARMYLNPTLKDLPQKTFVFIYTDKKDRPFGTISFDAAQLAAADAKSLNYSKLLNLAVTVDLTPVGKESAAAFCSEHQSEAKAFCAKAL